MRIEDYVDYLQKMIEKHIDMLHGITIPIKIKFLKKNLYSFSHFPIVLHASMASVSASVSAGHKAILNRVIFDVLSMYQMYNRYYVTNQNISRLQKWCFKLFGMEHYIKRRIEIAVVHEFRHVQQFKFINDNNLDWMYYSNFNRYTGYKNNFMEKDAHLASNLIIEGKQELVPDLKDVFAPYWYPRNRKKSSRMIRFDALCNIIKLRL